MDIFEINLAKNLPSFRQSTEIDGVVYNLEFLFNDVMGAWVLDLLDAEENPIQLGMPLLPNFPLTAQTKNRPNFPQGEFLVVDETGKSRTPNMENTDNIKLVYVSYK